MTRIFLDDQQIDEFVGIDIFDSMEDIFEDEWEALTESEETDWFGSDDPEL